VLLALVAALMLALAPAPPPAHAHDTLIATDPEDGTTLETSPEQITLTFSANVLDVSPVVRISDEDGELLTELTPRVEGPEAIADITEPLPAGTHTIQWRVVSSDGHPIEGEFTITVEQDPAPEEGAGENDQQPSDGGGEQDEQSAPTSEDGQADETDEPAPTSEDGEADESAETAAEGGADESGSSTVPLLLSVIGVAVVGVAIAAFFALRRKP